MLKNFYVLKTGTSETSVGESRAWGRPDALTRDGRLS